MLLRSPPSAASSLRLAPSRYGSCRSGNALALRTNAPASAWRVRCAHSRRTIQSEAQRNHRQDHSRHDSQCCAAPASCLKRPSPARAARCCPQRSSPILNGCLSVPRDGRYAGSQHVGKNWRRGAAAHRFNLQALHSGWDVNLWANEDSGVTYGEYPLILGGIMAVKRRCPVGRSYPAAEERGVGCLRRQVSKCRGTI